MKNTLLFALIFTLISTPLISQTPLWEGKGRIVISSDGNEHDHDDWPATPFTLALLASQNMQQYVKVYVFSDHIWGSNEEHKEAAEQMRTSAYEGQKMFGFDNAKFIEGVKNPQKAVKAMVKEINKSTAKNPLIMIAAGPMEVVGRALAAAKPGKLNYVTLLSHSNWNNNHADKPYSKWENHSGWTFNEIKDTHALNGLKCIKIADQNGGDDYDGMRAVREKFDWVKTSTARANSAYKEGSWDWLYTRLETCIKLRGTEFDPSDAGMIIYLLTGIEKTDPEDARRLMENPK